MFDFDKEIDRSNTMSLKWDKYKGRDVLPMWVADTDFLSPPGVIEALTQRVAHGIFGYSRPSPRLIELIINRLADRYGWHIEPEWLVFLPGVVPGLNLACRAWTAPGRGVITPKPVYYPFLLAPGFNERPLLTVPMQEVAGRWVLDLDELELQASGADLLLLCHPHNPGGTVFTRDELAAIDAIAARHNLVVCSDEIHCDLILDPDARHLPYGALSEEAAQRCAVMMAPSKTFNIAGLCCSFAVIPNERLRLKLQQAMRGISADVNLLGFVAAEAAYESGEAWLDAQLDYLRGNLALIEQAVARWPGVKLARHQATYLAWLDVTALGLGDPIAFFEQAGVGLSPGAQFGDGQCVRLNFGCPRARLQQALTRMEQAILAHLG
ncbi:MalY/PatB family protein [Aeromonas simiae]|uniref:MalY/PatB family protein n=1 Tax=Aeromonas simiae TaxID=218936 RepID=UPI00266CD1B1|nr:PatB family C-S lyase [Aeromonas simiae]MDO2946837.1 PatB family C-S lyase [Aeromonas simiae]MDO2951362.1 PatB family C-S lyase [Aeromonas simiae]MDO2954569.1 PatB family C-S lyase [Aeromonas simiae]